MSNKQTREPYLFEYQCDLVIARWLGFDYMQKYVKPLNSNEKIYYYSFFKFMPKIEKLITFHVPNLWREK